MFKEKQNLNKFTFSQLGFLLDWFLIHYYFAGKRSPGSALTLSDTGGLKQPTAF